MLKELMVPNTAGIVSNGLTWKVAETIRNGKPYQTGWNYPPADPRVAQKDN